MQAGEGESGDLNGSVTVALQESSSSTPWVGVTAPPGETTPAETTAQNFSITAPRGRSDLRQPLLNHSPDFGATFRSILHRIQKLEEPSGRGSRIGDSPRPRSWYAISVALVAGRNARVAGCPEQVKILGPESLDGRG